MSIFVKLGRINIINLNKSCSMLGQVWPIFTGLIQTTINNYLKFSIPTSLVLKSRLSRQFISTQNRIVWGRISSVTVSISWANGEWWWDCCASLNILSQAIQSWSTSMWGWRHYDGGHGDLGVAQASSVMPYKHTSTSSWCKVRTSWGQLSLRCRPCG